MFEVETIFEQSANVDSSSHFDKSTENRQSVLLSGSDHQLLDTETIRALWTQHMKQTMSN